jgi:hypothetical protein
MTKTKSTNKGRKDNAVATRTVTKPRKGPTTPPPYYNNLVSKVCGLTDPFCQHARTAKYPDDSSVYTLNYPYHETFALLTGETGDSAYMFSPQYYNKSYTYPTAIVGAVTSAWANFGTQYTLGSTDKYRIVSYGLRLKRITAPLTSSGMVHIRVWPVTQLAECEVLDLRSYNCTFWADIPLQDLKDCTIVLPHTNQMPQLFYDTSDDKAAFNNVTTKGFCPVTVFVTGAPASASVIQVEIVANYEVTFETGTGMAQLGTPAPPADPVLVGAANYVTSQLKPVMVSGVESFGKYIVGQAKNALYTLLARRFPMSTALATLVD